MGAKIHLVVGAQFGSEAKGAVAAFLSKEVQGPVFGVRVGGPNAGHTVYGACHRRCTVGEHPDGGSLRTSHPWRLRQIPVMAVSRPDSVLYIAAGSEIDIDVLFDEIDKLDDAGYNVSSRLVIDASATVIEQGHKDAEQGSDLNARLGSTAKGIGAARADRIMRRASQVRDWTYDPNGEEDRSMTYIPMNLVGDVTYKLQRAAATDGAAIIIEGTQGYGLGLHTLYYPFTTSGDCRGVDLLAQCGLSPWAVNAEIHTWLVMRPNPIRVAGNSGPLHGETTWEDLGLEEELTTVTKKTRRVGEWDPDLVRDAIEANGGLHPNLHLVLTMLDHKVPQIAGATSRTNLAELVIQHAQAAVARIEKTLPYGAQIGLVGTGPDSMMWYRTEDLNAVKRLEPFRELKSVMSNIIQVMSFPRAETLAREVEGQLRSDDELTDWWLQRAQSEVAPMAAKAEEYGGKGAAIDLVDIGTDLGRLIRGEILSTEEATELGIYFYLKGKFSRWTAALMEGRRVSDDTLLDIGVYVRMAQRTREVGGWPYGPDKEDA